MQAEAKPKSGYASSEITKPPNWHGLVAWDLLFNNLTTGLFLVAALGELVRPRAFGPLGRAAYPIALALLLVDLACLVLDLGNPLRFHHMLRVFKPTSPMSLGTWCLTAYSLPLAVLAAVDLSVALHLLPEGSPSLGVVRKACLIVGLVPALGSAVYKGVLFSTSSQPAWRDARWLGGYLVNSALTLGAAELLAIALVMGQGGAARVLRPALAILLAIHVVPLALMAAELYPGLRRVRTGSQMFRLAVVAVGLGLAVPLALTFAAAGLPAILIALASMIAGSMAIRRTIVMIPHLMRGREDRPKGC